MATFVQAIDGLFYKNPVLVGQDWWATFEDDLEIIIRRFKNSTPDSGRTRASKVMREMGMEFKIVSYEQRSSRPFPPDWKKIYECYSFGFQLLGPIPVPEVYNAVVSEPGAVWDHCIYGFFSDVPTIDVVRVVVGMDIDPLIARALLASAIYKKQQERVRAELCKKLYAQHPWLREVDRGNWQKILETKPERIKIAWKD